MSSGTRLVAMDQKATNRPSALTDGVVACASAWASSLLRLTSSVSPVSRSWIGQLEVPVRVVRDQVGREQGEDHPSTVGADRRRGRRGVAFLAAAGSRSPARSYRRREVAHVDVVGRGSRPRGRGCEVGDTNATNRPSSLIEGLWPPSGTLGLA